MTVLHIDLETRSTVKLPETGVYKYAEDASTDIWFVGYAFDDEEPQLWNPGEAIPERIVAHITAGGECRAHNSSFERVMFNYVVGPKHGWPLPALEQWVCSAAEAAAMSLPRSLGQLCEVTGVKVQKDAEGSSLMLRMCRPRKIHDDGTLEWWTVPDKIARLGAYCRTDVRAEQAVEKVLRRLTPLEREHYLECERQNDRGIQVDVALVTAAREVADEGIARANAALEQLTGGEVSKVTNHSRLRQWVNDQGVDTDSVSKKAVRELLESDLDPKVREVLEHRADAGRSSIAKLDSLLECACTDGKIRGMTLFHGAGTGRETGRLAQVQNFPRPEIKKVERFVEPLLRRAYEEINLFYHPIPVISSLLRGMLTASPGHRLLRADFNAIEARVLSVLAGQEDDVALFRAGGDPYIRMAARLFNIPESQVTPAQRQAGKFAILGAGYQMGAKKAVSAAKMIYNLTLTPEEAKHIIDLYRSTHSHVVAFWENSNAAAMEAVSKPGEVITFGALHNLKFTKQGAYLYLVLPAKRVLAYAAPRIVDREMPWSTPEHPSFRPAVEISAINPQTRQWSRNALYGGLIVENIVQAVSRDLMAEAKLRVETAGYPVALSIHDELVADVPDGVGSLVEFVSLMEECPAWAATWPVKAEGVESFRFGK